MLFRDKMHLDRPFGNGFKYLVYHFGTILYGSFIMALFEVIKNIMKYLQQKRDISIFNRIMVEIILCLISCCQAVWDMVSSNAYYVTAMFGFAFCDALRFGQELTDLGVTSVFYVVGNVVVMVGSVFVGVFTAGITKEIVDPVHSTAVTYLIIVLTSFCVSAMVLTAYSVRVINR